MADTIKARERLEAAKLLFIERYRIRPGIDKSKGLDEIDQILDQAQPNVTAMRKLVNKYNLYPEYEGRINAVLDEAAAALAGGEEAPVETPVPPQESPVTPEPPPEPEPEPAPRRGRPRKTEEEGVSDGSDS